MSKQKGFTLVEGLLIVLILSVVGFAGYTVWSNQQNDGNTNRETDVSKNQVQNKDNDVSDSQSEDNNDNSLASTLSEIYFKEYPEQSQNDYRFVVSNDDIKDSITPGYQVVAVTVESLDGPGGNGANFYMKINGEWVFGYRNFGEPPVCSQFVEDKDAQKAFSDVECFGDETNAVSTVTVSKYFNL